MALFGYVWCMPTLLLGLGLGRLLLSVLGAALRPCDIVALLGYVWFVGCGVGSCLGMPTLLLG